MSRLETQAARVNPLVKEADRAAGEFYVVKVRELEERIASRARHVAQQASRPEPKVPEFELGRPVNIAEGWNVKSESEDARVVEEGNGDSRCYVIEAGRSSSCVASWRRTLVLPEGTYRFSAELDIRDVKPLEDGAQSGAGIRISGSGRDHGRAGTGGFKILTYEFQVDEESREVVLVAELRAARGRARFRADGFTLERFELP